MKRLLILLSLLAVARRCCSQKVRSGLRISTARSLSG